MRRGVGLLVFGVLGLALGLASGRASGADTTTGTTTTTTPSYAPLATSSLPAGCVGAGTAAVVPPSHPVIALGTPASDLGPSSYPTSASVGAFDSASVSGSTCRSTTLTLESVSLFGGAVTASSIAATDGKGTVAGLEIDGTPVSLTAGQTVPVDSWGRLTLGGTIGRLTAPLVLRLLQPHDSLLAGTTLVVAFAAAPRPAVKSRKKHHSSGATGQRHQPQAARAQKRAKLRSKTKKKRRHRKHHSHPLKVTPPLGFRPPHYVFPIDGGASYIDTYGADRADVSGGWHHGDDLFAPLGIPVVAVTNGTLSLIGWESIGGWRLWLTDGEGNSFYYAHLAAYSRWVLDHPHVRAGQVIGFLGRTGDAFTTAPHVHFEIHPHQFIKLGYDGAVDPTAYLRKWRVVRVPDKEMPRPAKLKAPSGTPTEEASVVWHQLLVARHLLHATSGAADPMAAHLSFPPELIGPLGQSSRIASAGTSPLQSPSRGSRWWAGGVLGGLFLLVTPGLVFFRRRRQAPEPITDSSPSN